MKYYRFILLIILLVLVFLGFQIPSAKNLTSQPQPTSQAVQKTVTVVIDDGLVQKTYTDIAGSNAHEALLESAKQGNFEVKSKQYDFGVFVEAIADKSNTKEKSWIYSVNDVSGDIAADKKSLNPGDMVSWRYIVSTTE